MTVLNIGHIHYINCVPFFHFLPATLEGHAARVVQGVPSRLNAMLHEGAIDVSPSSSFEYARNWRQYLLLPEHSISSFGDVQSVLLFSRRNLEDLKDEVFYLTGESATSINLLQVLLREYLGCENFRSTVPDRPVEELIAEGKTALLIGDRALRAARNRIEGQQIYDLGGLWKRFTGLPFVFALWILRRDAAEKKKEALRALRRQLAQSRVQAMENLAELAAETPEKEWMGEEGLVDYWRCMSYDLGEEHLRGVRHFFHLCAKYGLLPEEPEIHFFE